MKGISFYQFCHLLEEMAKFMFKGRADTYTTYDMVEELYTKIMFL